MGNHGTSSAESCIRCRIRHGQVGGRNKKGERPKNELAKVRLEEEDSKRVLPNARLPSRLRIRLWNSSFTSTLLYGCESWKLTQAARRKLNSTASKMLSRITGRTIADEAREPSVDVVMRARDQRWNWLGHILRMERHRLTRLQCIKPTPESILGDVSGPEIQAEINTAKERVEWKKNRPSRRC